MLLKIKQYTQRFWLVYGFDIILYYIKPQLGSFYECNNLSLQSNKN